MIFVVLVGLVELVMESETLRKIQVRGHGLAGSFNDRTIVEWLQVHNPTELDYRKVNNNQRGGLVVGRRTCDLRFAGSRPGRDAAA